jgi:YjbE family integral membrane protein
VCTLEIRELECSVPIEIRVETGAAALRLAAAAGPTGNRAPILVHGGRAAARLVNEGKRGRTLVPFGAARFLVDLLRITSIDILLSGDNAVVIALATRSLPEAQRKVAVMGGSAAAVGLRVAFCLIITSLLEIPYLKMVGGLLLLYIGVKLVIPEGKAHGSSVTAKSHTWAAIRTILIADAVMSLDNVVAIAAAAHGSALLIALGLVISIPLIVFGSQLVLRVLNRFAILVVLGGGLLGWIAGETIVSDPAVYTHLPYDEPLQAQVAKLLGAMLVMATGTVLSGRLRAQEQEVVDLAPEDQK